MAVYFTSHTNLSFPPVEVVTPDSADRMVTLRYGGGGSITVFFGFTQAEVDTGNEGFPLNATGVAGERTFLLSARESVWVRADGTGVTPFVDAFVTKAG